MTRAPSRWTPTAALPPRRGADSSTGDRRSGRGARHRRSVRRDRHVARDRAPAQPAGGPDRGCGGIAPAGDRARRAEPATRSSSGSSAGAGPTSMRPATFPVPLGRAGAGRPRPRAWRWPCAPPGTRARCTGTRSAGASRSPASARAATARRDARHRLGCWRGPWRPSTDASAGGRPTRWSCGAGQCSRAGAGADRRSARWRAGGRPDQRVHASDEHRGGGDQSRAGDRGEAGRMDRAARARTIMAIRLTRGPPGPGRPRSRRPGPAVAEHELERQVEDQRAAVGHQQGHVLGARTAGT